MSAAEMTAAEDAAFRAATDTAAASTNGHHANAATATATNDPSRQTVREPARKLDVPALLAQPDEPIPYRLDRFVADGCVTALAGHGGEGKSLLAAAAAISVALGGTVAGITATKGHAVIFDAEQGERLIAKRLKLTGAPARGVAVYEATGLNLAKHADWIIDTIRAENAQLVVLDSLRTLAPGMAENDGDTVLPVTAALRRIARETQAALLVLHHRPKHGPGYRGSSVLRDQIDALFVLGRDPQDPERRTRRYLHCDPARDGKMRFDVEPAERWLDIEVRAGLLTVTEAEPYAAATREPSRTETRAQEIVQALTDGARLRRADIARKLGLDPTDASVGRALAELVKNGTVKRHEDKTYSPILSSDNPDDNLTNGQDCRIANNPLKGVGNDKASAQQQLDTPADPPSPGEDS